MYNTNILLRFLCLSGLFVGFTVSFLWSVRGNGEMSVVLFIVSRMWYVLDFQLFTSDVRQLLCYIFRPCFG